MKNNKKRQGVTPNYENSWGDPSHHQQQQQHESYYQKFQLGLSSYLVECYSKKHTTQQISD